ncbi:RNA polymerase sigma-70 factor [Butyricimonas synergistica]|uniref:RNA polymerase sigma-70 factor n=1 Tax=Butyricimonas synergistica TaxID=544644 RepID=UPI000382C5C7|nr:RNA polymerase sigma-70 factor [Butyricimonas synergistica]
MSKDFLEHKVFEELFDLHYGNLVGCVYGYVRDEEVAKDIVHDTFLTFWNNRKRLDLSYSAKSYLFTLAQNYALNYLRHLRVVEVNEREVTELLESASDELVEYDERIARVEKKLVQLPDKQREVFLKCVVEEKKYQEVADELKVSINTVKKHMARALKFLRDELQDETILLFLLCDK